MAHILNCLPDRVGLAAAALHLGLTQQTIEIAFARTAINPRDHLRQARLLALHQDLLAGRFDTTEAAFVRWGFPARSENTTSDYRRLFGRAPASTLRSGARRVRSTLQVAPHSHSIVPGGFDVTS